MNTNSTLDQPSSRVDPQRQSVAGHSMGGGGSLIAAQNNPTLKAAFPADAVEHGRIVQPAEGAHDDHRRRWRHHRLGRVAFAPNMPSAMRESYFGKEGAQRLFGEEEAVTRRLLELMREDRTATASVEQKAMAAQARYSQEQRPAR